MTTGQATTETRKELQRQYMASSDAAQRPLQSWSALQHYSRRELQAFEHAQNPRALDEVQALARARANMLGFRGWHLSGVSG